MLSSLDCAGGVFFVEDEQEAEVVIKGCIFGDFAGAEGVVEEAARLVAVFVGQGVGEDAQAERVAVETFAHALALLRRAADAEVVEQLCAALGGEAV